MFKNKKMIVLISMLALLSFTLVGCGGSKSPQNKAGKDTVRLVYVEWACATASAHVVAEVLENKMGYNVELTPVAAPLLFEALANGDADAMTTAWLPITHESYMKKVDGKVENLGPNCEGAKLAIVVPEYVTINSIDEMNDYKDKFKGQIVGIDPGAGVMKLTEKAIKDYGLDYQLVEGSDATMTAALKSAIDKNEWVAVTGWIPHWKFARWDLKTLEDPKKVLGEAEHIDTVVRPGLKEDMPEVYEFLKKFKWDVDDLQNAMLMTLESGTDSKEAARKWVDKNPELVNSWLPDKYKK
ncbi:ABC-type glycine betaine transport system, substrate-binding domain [Syntrophomonas zehnderi OL-4]|uniref:ABC-type glycine betaine transport system, substrate-binding domain n=1 Tax=Syntrophomonas zehnderi OL-4 TaxID=690567 RepID=A0A0E4GEF9_9FIRM|nr:glycine betaine ABC transporter substrate-binding protein [Syntrophomonas zehnderi]CFW98930.1 ABC-type glycine betaine transport system, substrate-binding domain [Syntrophomonas zehnderi OL-4]CFX87819.1 ABC-type glycine betaine transport system, substrate-binding domain [Syntrophomonas zehnderi OL-4]